MLLEASVKRKKIESRNCSDPRSSRCSSKYRLRSDYFHILQSLFDVSRHGSTKSFPLFFILEENSSNFSSVRFEPFRFRSGLPKFLLPKCFDSVKFTPATANMCKQSNRLRTRLWIVNLTFRLRTVGHDWLTRTGHHAHTYIVQPVINNQFKYQPVTKPRFHPKKNHIRNCSIRAVIKIALTIFISAK